MEEPPPILASASEIHRWFDRKPVIINGKTPKFDDIVESPVREITLIDECHIAFQGKRLFPSHDNSTCLSPVCSESYYKVSFRLRHVEKK